MRAAVPKSESIPSETAARTELIFNTDPVRGWRGLGSNFPKHRGKNYEGETWIYFYDGELLSFRPTSASGSEAPRRWRKRLMFGFFRLRLNYGNMFRL